MLKRSLALVAMGVVLSGCYMVPLALVGPAASGWTQASLIQSGITTTASFMVEKSSGKSIAEHALSLVDIDETILQQSYLPKEKNIKVIKITNPLHKTKEVY